MTPFEVWGGVVNIPGVSVGSITHEYQKTGVTVILCPKGTVGGVDVAGGAPATRETPLLDPVNTIAGPDAVVLTGGSALGLQTADGVAEGLQHMGRGVEVGPIRIPIVVAAAIFDMEVGEPTPPNIADGLRALEEAGLGRQKVDEGAYGAGTGATVGKTLGMEAAMAGGQGAVTLKTGDGLLVSALVVVNAVGSVLGDDGSVIAGPRIEGIPQSTTNLWALSPGRFSAGTSTSIGIIVTNAQLSKAELTRVARMGHDGLARSIDPVHTPWDGDTLFACSVGDKPDEVGRVGALAAHAVALAVRRSVAPGKSRGG